MFTITDTRSPSRTSPLIRAGRLVALAAVAAAAAAPRDAHAAPCPTDLPNPIYGAGGSAVTATLGAVATALAGLPEAQRTTIFYWDPGACAGYQSFVKGDTRPAYFKFWSAQGQLTQCEATGSEPLTFAHMGNTPALCPANEPLPAGFGRFGAPVQTINFVTHARSEFDAISAEALYHVLGFGPGAAGRQVAPWTVPQAVFARPTNSFVHQIIAKALGVPPTGFKVPEANFLSTNPQTVQAVFQWGETTSPSQALGYVSGSAADKGEDDRQVKTLALQSFDQTCAYLPDSSRTRKDKANVRSGQYALWTPAWFYGRVGADGKLSDPAVANLVGLFDGSVTPPGGIDVTEIVIKSGDVPLCAMQANRPEGDLSPVQSYQPANPCNGYFEFVATGTTSLKACESTAQCNAGAGEQCRFGFCEKY